MITNITLENFKCFRKVEINPKLVTLFIGPNGTGKSGVLQALLLLKQSKDASVALDLDGNQANLDSHDFMLHSADPNWDNVGLRLSGSWEANASEIQSPIEFWVQLQYGPLGAIVGSKKGTTRFTFTGQKRDISTDLASRRLSTSSLGGSGIVTPGTGLNIADVDLSASPTDNRLRQAFHVPTILVQNIRTIPAARGLSSQIYPLGPEAVEHIATKDLNQQQNDVISTLAYSGESVPSKLSSWMTQVTGVGFKTNLVPSRSVKPVSITSSGEVGLVAEGFGTNALVHLLLELARTEPGATVLVEEPEIHLHPKAQADLASVIVEEAKSSNKQVIMTTHSEHIAGRLLTLVAEKAITPEEVAIYSFEKDPETGVCSASEIEVTPRGQVTGGLKSFFETDREELRRYVNAMRTHE